MAEIDSAQLQALIDHLYGEQSDRAGAVMGVATLDALIENLLRSWILPDAPKQLFNSTGALATFSAKIDIAYAFGLISLRERRDLHLLRKIRNDFAHDFDYKLTFNNPALSDRIMTLSLPALLEVDPTFREGSSPRYRFYLAISLLILVLSQVRVRAAKSPPLVKELTAPVSESAHVRKSLLKRLLDPLTAYIRRR
jgi:DNA-binding MltR family transcriptional regulator